MTNTYTASDVRRITGVTYRKLDYWIRHGFLNHTDPFPGSGATRTFTSEDIDRIRLLQRASRLHQQDLAALAEYVDHVDQLIGYTLAWTGHRSEALVWLQRKAVELDG
jgi:DNA-binding transcriptional MerR regulator